VDRTFHFPATSASESVARAALLWLGGMFFIAVAGAPVLRSGVLGEPACWRTPTGQALGWKLAVMVVAAAVRLARGG
jgi:hypothetical protein